MILLSIRKVFDIRLTPWLRNRFGLTILKNTTRHGFLPIKKSITLKTKF